MSVFTIADGNLLVSGDNEFGQLGTGNCENVEYPIEIKLGVEISDVSCGASHTIAIDIYGGLWACGSNNLGQLGLGHNEDMYSFVKVSDKEFAAVSCYDDYTLAIDNKGFLRECGYNHIANVGATNFLRKVTDCTFNSVCVGPNYIVAIDQSGCLWTCGDNEYGQLGFSDFKYRTSLEKVPSPTFKVKDPTSNGIEIGWYKYNPEFGFLYTAPIRFISRHVMLTHVSRSSTYMTAIDNEGCVWICGEGKLGLRNLGKLVNPDCGSKIHIEVKNIVCGPNVIAAMDIHGRVYQYTFEDISVLSMIKNLGNFSRIADLEFDYITLLGSHVICIGKNLLWQYHAIDSTSNKIYGLGVYYLNEYGYVRSTKIFSSDNRSTAPKIVFGQIIKKDANAYFS